jgi:LAO/AO transport system kinase
MLELSDLAHDGWHPPIIATVGNTGQGVTELWDAIVRHRAEITTNGLLQQRREFRLREELREIVARRLEQRARQICTGERWEAIQAEVLGHSIDPWSAADEMLRGVGA